LKKIIIQNLLILIFLLIFFYGAVAILNLILSGQPRYWEIVHNKNITNIKINNEKIIQLKKDKKEIVNYLDVRTSGYKELGYTGIITKKKCGSIENGFYDLIYQTDMFGFRENTNLRYDLSDYVLLGDSFVLSICENKPNDLKSNLEQKTSFSFLNLGMHGTDYPSQSLNLLHYTNKTNFKGLIWFFYEGNDYEQKSFQVNELPFNIHKKLIIKKDNIYESNIEHSISVIFKFKVWLAEFIRGPSVLIKFFKNYNHLLDKKDYEGTVSSIREYLNQKNIEDKYIVYIPSWQKLSLHKLKKLAIYNKHPQVIQLNTLKNDVKKIAEKYNFKFIDTDNYFLQLKDPLSVFHYGLNTHFNSLGNDILSRAIVDSL
tara:strand:+ start:1643 stop:2758 length:1116 start_codon:yes stop_codon:yes gene_type:complete